ncbi:hypothetical protein E2562_039506, partial [Oryza meyeriana var. granulata]
MVSGNLGNQPPLRSPSVSLSYHAREVSTFSPAFPSLASKAAPGGGSYLRLLSPLSQALPCPAPDLLSPGPELRAAVATGPAPELLAAAPATSPRLPSSRWRRLLAPAPKLPAVAVDTGPRRPSSRRPRLPALAPELHKAVAATGPRRPSSRQRRLPCLAPCAPGGGSGTLPGARAPSGYPPELPAVAGPRSPAPVPGLQAVAAAHKARLVAKGYVQQPGVDFDEVFAPVARIESVRLLLALTAQEGWPVHHMDVKSAFLNGELIEEVYVRQPPGFTVAGHEDKVLRLDKALYGLRQAPRAWNAKLDETLVALGFSHSASEHAVYARSKGASRLL